jgi:hypothetical protein
VTFIDIREAEAPRGAKTRRWTVHATRGGAQLGIVQWWSGWRRYAFQPCLPTAFEEVCLREIAGFVEDRTAEHKAGKSPK